MTTKRLPYVHLDLLGLRTGAFILCLALLALALGRTASAQQPRVIAFDAPGATATVPDGLTLTGTIVGYYLDENFVAHGFLRTPDGHFTSFDAPGAGTTPDNSNGTFPLGVNQLGTVVGYYEDDNSVSHCFIRTADGKITTFDAPGADVSPAAQAGSQLTGISPTGLTVGLYTGSNLVTHGFLRSPGGQFTSFDASPNSVSTFPNGPVNLEGALVGFYADTAPRFHAFVRDPRGTISVLTFPDSCDGTIPEGCVGFGDLNINLFGWSVGTFQDANLVHHGFLRSPDGEITAFDAPGAGNVGPYQGTIFSYNFTPDGNEVAGLNDLGAVAATYLDADYVYHGFLRTPDGKFTSFDAPGADLTPGALNGTFPFAINDLGVVIGIYTDANYLPHGFIREP